MRTAVARVRQYHKLRFPCDPGGTQRRSLGRACSTSRLLRCTHPVPSPAVSKTYQGGCTSMGVSSSQCTTTWDGWATSTIWKGCMVYEARHPFHGSSQHVGRRRWLGHFSHMEGMHGIRGSSPLPWEQPACGADMGGRDMFTSAWGTRRHLCAQVQQQYVRMLARAAPGCHVQRWSD